MVKVMHLEKLVIEVKAGVKVKVEPHGSYKLLLLFF